MVPNAGPFTRLAPPTPRHFLVGPAEQPSVGILCVRGLGHAAGWVVVIVGLDATPLVGPRTGIGRYVAELCRAVAEQPDAPEQVLTLFSRPRPLGIEPPPGAHAAPRSCPARILHPLWRAISFPPVEFLSGRLNVFHGGNYVVPPVRHAGTVMTIHDLTCAFYPQTLAPATAKMLADLPQRARRMDAVVTPTQAVAQEVMAEYGLPAERVTAIAHGVDPAWASATPLDESRRQALDVPERYLLFVGTLEPRKNLAGLVAAYAQARAARPGLAPLLLVGARGWGEQADQQVDGIQALGYLDDSDVQSLVAGALAVCSPSLYEGFGLPVLEGLATGGTVIASDIAAHREVAAGQARLVPVDDVEAWAQALLDADAAGEPTPDERAARQAVAARHTWARSAAAHLDVYRRVARS